MNGGASVPRSLGGCGRHRLGGSRRRGLWRRIRFSPPEAASSGRCAAKATDSRTPPQTVALPLKSKDVNAKECEHGHFCQRRPDSHRVRRGRDEPSLPAVTVGVATRHRIAVHEAHRNKSICFVHGRASVVEIDVSAGRPQQRRLLVTTDEVCLVEVCAPVTERTDPDNASIICDIQFGSLVSYPSAPPCRRPPSGGDHESRRWSSDTSFGAPTLRTAGVFTLPMTALISRASRYRLSASAAASASRAGRFSAITLDARSIALVNKSSTRLRTSGRLIARLSGSEISDPPNPALEIAR